ncbi:hypothetical protein QO002_005149 [Pararhizobium capsulatum DSM 1112]|uniref:Uncharacterized protein n=1 Tax=Pararhizobium capsulatum DSM 1112 TaxID=1121113 RepID=A0ABU0BYB0_9HYPH|nr:hypothetical protein [Pararhizobium capsulatum]MDQ0322943.1 hypothetical protein [Pararhizobium capsulatum DSM 1112]
MDNAFLKTTHELFLKIAARDSAHSKFRVSRVKKDAGKFTVQWSYAVSPLASLTTAAFPIEHLPLLSDGDSLILVETEVTPPAINTFRPMEVANYSNTQFARPRFTAAVATTN